MLLGDEVFSLILVPNAFGTARAFASLFSYAILAIGKRIRSNNPSAGLLYSINIL